MLANIDDNDDDNAFFDNFGTHGSIHSIIQAFWLRIKMAIFKEMLSNKEVDEIIWILQTLQQWNQK